MSDNSLQTARNVGEGLVIAYGVYLACKTGAAYVSEQAIAKAETQKPKAVQISRARLERLPSRANDPVIDWLRKQS